MNDTRIIQSFSDDAFCTQALAEFTARQTEKYSKWMQLVETVSQQDDYVTDAEIETMITEAGFNPDAYINIVDAWYTLRDYLCSVRDEFCITDQNGELSANDFLTDTFLLHNTSYGDPVTWEEACNHMQSTLHSSVCLQAACEAMAAPAEDKLTVYRDTISDYFQDAQSSTSDSAMYFKNLLLKVENPGEFVHAVADKMSTHERAEAEVPSMVQPDIAKYSGASPCSLLEFGVSCDYLNPVFATGAKILKSVFDGILSVVKKGFKWVADKIVNTLVDPQDIYQNPALVGGGPLFENFFWQYDDYIDFDFPLTYPLAQAQNVYNALKNHVNSKEMWGRWFCSKFIGGEILCRIDHFSFKSPVADGDPYGIRFYGVFQFKPKALNLDSLAATYPADDTDVSTEAILDWITKFKSQAMYAPSGLTEEQYYCSFVAGILMTEAMLQYSARDLLGFSEGLSGSHPAIQGTLYGANYDSVVGNINNNNAVYIASGVEGSFAPTDLSITTSLGAIVQVSGLVSRRSVERLISNYLAQLLYVITYEEAHPFDALFVPYSNGYQPFTKGEYSIKTDTQNAVAFTAFVTTAILAVVAVVVGVTAKVVISKISRSGFFKRQAKLGQLDNKMWSGEQLTKKEQKLYARYTKKQQRCALLSEGLTSGSPQDPINSNIEAELQNAFTLYITGPLDE